MKKSKIKPKEFEDVIDSFANRELLEKEGERWVLKPEYRLNFS